MGTEMDIRKINGGSVIQKYEEKAREVNIKRTDAEGSKDIIDKISISEDAKNKNINIASIAVGMIKDDSQKEFSVEKLNVIREKIQSGSYSVPSSAIARAVLRGLYAE